MSDIIIQIPLAETIIALMAGAFLAYIIQRRVKEGEKFKQYEGYAVASIKAAENTSTDDTENRGAAKLDFALRTFLSKYESAIGTMPDAETVARIESWLIAVHTSLEESGTFNNKGVNYDLLPKIGFTPQEKPLVTPVLAAIRRKGDE